MLCLCKVRRLVCAFVCACQAATIVIVIVIVIVTATVTVIVIVIVIVTVTAVTAAVTMCVCWAPPHFLHPHTSMACPHPLACCRATIRVTRVHRLSVHRGCRMAG